MGRMTAVYIIALVVGLPLLGPFAAPTPTWAGEWSGQISPRLPNPDLAVLAEESRWLELMAAATEAARRNATDPTLQAYQIQAMRILGESEAALKQADEAVARFPDNASVLLERAWVHLFRGNWPLALADARRVAGIDPALYDAANIQGIAYRELHEWDNAIMAYGKALSLRPGDATALLNRGRAYVEKGMWLEALTDLGKSISLNDRSAEAFYYRGRAHAGSGKLLDAAKDFTAAICLRPEAAAPYVARAEVLAREGRWEAAARDAYTAIALGSREISPYLTACQASVALGDFDALAEYAAGGIGIAPHNPAFHRFSGRAFREKGELTNALAAYDQALQVAPGDAGVLLERAMTGILSRRYGQAIEDCSASLAVKISSTAYALRAFAQLKSGAFDQALEDSTNALTLEPNEGMALLVRANVSLAKGMTADALGDSRKALQLDSGQPWAYITYGSALVMDGRREDGLKLLDQAIKMTPGDGEALLARGRCLAAMGRTDDAAKDFEKAATDALIRETALEEIRKLRQG